MLLNLGRYARPYGRASKAASGLSMPASTVFDLDATQSASYSGSGTDIENLISSPPELGDYTFRNGSAIGTNTFTFTGTAGDDAAYFLSDNTLDTINHPAATAAEQPDFILDFHKATEGQKGWIAAAFQTPSSYPGGAENSIFGNQDNVAQHGFRARYDATNEQIVFEIANGGSGVQFNFPVVLTTEADHFIAFSLSHTGGNTTVTMYLDSIYGVSQTKAVSTTTDANGNMSFMTDDSGNGLGSGTRFYWGGMGNDELTSANVQEILTIIEARHARTYFSDDLPDTDPLAGVSGITGHYSAAFPGGWKASWGDIQTVSNLVDAGDPDFYYGSDGTEEAAQPYIAAPLGTAEAGFEWADEDEALVLKSASGAIAGAHRSDLDGFWIAIVFTTPATVTGTETMFQTWLGGGGSAGFSIRYAADERIDLQQYNGSTSAVAGDLTGILQGSTQYILIVSWDGTSTSNNVRGWLNSATATEVSLTFGASTSDSTQAPVVGNVPAALTAAMDAGMIIHDIAWGEAFLDNTAAGNIITAQETIYGDLTP